MLRGNNEENTPELAQPFFERAPKILENNGRLAKTCAPLIFSGDLFIFRATTPVEENERLVALDEWEPYIGGRIEMYDIHCKHGDMIKSENLMEIGQILSKKLDECYESVAKKEA
ncbi:hypothetical protein BGZ49_004179 [Haplosporangium sp. Z 27]|nr:hypothetical protein BGZ49_004179 [Haplosporangium sp. Z 27]